MKLAARSILPLYWVQLLLHFCRNCKIFEIDPFFESFWKKCRIVKSPTYWRQSVHCLWRLSASNYLNTLKLIHSISMCYLKHNTIILKSYPVLCIYLKVCWFYWSPRRNILYTVISLQFYINHAANIVQLFAISMPPSDDINVLACIFLCESKAVTRRS